MSGSFCGAFGAEQLLSEGELAGNDPIDIYLKQFPPPFAPAHNLGFHAKAFQKWPQKSAETSKWGGAPL